MSNKYRDHILALAEELGVLVHEEAGMPTSAGGAAGPAQTALLFGVFPVNVRAHIIVPPIAGEAEYVIALHELGHHGAKAWGQTDSTISGAFAQLAIEDAAWAWARAHASDWTPTMEGIAGVARGTYAAHVGKAARASVPGKPLSALFSKKGGR